MKDSGDDWTFGQVAYASPNGVAVAISLDGPLRGAYGVVLNMIPLMVDYRNETLTGVVNRDSYEIEVER
jgi:hypothetical protein